MTPVCVRSQLSALFSSVAHDSVFLQLGVGIDTVVIPGTVQCRPLDRLVAVGASRHRVRAIVASKMHSRQP